jgi:soluble P-type ATPase
MLYEIPKIGSLELKTVILDLNGTLSVRGSIVPGVPKRLATLRELGFRLVLLTGDTRGTASKTSSFLGVDLIRTESGTEKAAEAAALGPETAVSIGNGLIDLELMRTVRLRIVTLQAEGAHVQTLLNSDIVVPSINDALDMLIHPETLIATLRP